jgi:hypothetical protein
MGNRGSRHRDNVATSKRKRDGSDVDELRRVLKQPMPIQAQHGIVPLDNDSVPSLSIMPESVLLHIFSFALKSHKEVYSTSEAKILLQCKLLLRKHATDFLISYPKTLL